MPQLPSKSVRLSLIIAGGTAVMVLLAFGLYLRAAARTNHVSLAQAPKAVTVQRAQAAQYRPQRTYVGTLNPWVMANVGPQYVAAYAGLVLVRPGDRVKRGQVLGTLDCRNSSAESQAIASRAKAIEDRQVALAHELDRMKELLSGGFTSTNEVEQLSARTSADKAEMDSLKASLAVKTLAVDDCVLRAPFDGEVNERLMDPGAYVRPGNTVVTVIDRSTVRITADAPESDFAIVAPGTMMDIDVPATGQKLHAPVSRRAPSADRRTRTVDFEIDVPNADRKLPAGTTGIVTVQVGQPHPAADVPSRAATIRGEKASLFVVTDGTARRVVAPVLGEIEGQLYLDPGRLPPGSAVVTEGRALLDDGDRVSAQEAQP